VDEVGVLSLLGVVVPGLVVLVALQVAVVHAVLQVVVVQL